MDAQCVADSSIAMALHPAFVMAGELKKLKSDFSFTTNFFNNRSKQSCGQLLIVVSINGMFKGARSFDGDISKSDVSSVKNMNAMVLDAASFILVNVAI